MQANDQPQPDNNSDADELETNRNEFNHDVAENEESVVAQLQEELKESKDRGLRTMADMENLRKRTEREKVDIQKYAVESLVKDLVPFLDSFEKAAEQDSVKNPESQDGVGMIYKQFLTTLSKHGLEVIECAGAAFNPNFHQGIQKIESEEVKIDTVQKEFAKGYLLNGRLIRPAIVSVLVPLPHAAAAHKF